MAEKTILKPQGAAEAEVFMNLASIFEMAAATDEPHEHSGESDRLLRIAADMANFFAEGKTLEGSAENFAFDLAALVRAARLVPGDTESDERRALLERAGAILAELTEVDADKVIKPPADRPPLHRDKRGPWAKRQDTGNVHRDLNRVLTLIHSMHDIHEGGSTLADVGNLTSESSRLTELMYMAQEYTASAIRRLDDLGY